MITLIVTSQNHKTTVFDRFWQSILSQDDEVKKQLHLVFVNQSGENFFCEEKTFKIDIINVPKCSLSKARNYGLQYAPKDSIIGFPDDDCWYDKNVLSFVNKFFLSEASDFLCVGAYDPYQQKAYGGRPINYVVPVHLENALSLPISIGIFIKNSKGLKFDENFSVGAHWGCGEESDLILELLQQNKKGIYNSQAVVFHELEVKKLNNVQRTYSYGLGFGALLAKSIYKRKQKYFKKIYRKVLNKSLIGQVLFLFKPLKRRYYRARYNGLKKGFLEGKKQYQS